MTHPFHPLWGVEFELIAHHNCWGENRVTFVDGEGQLRALPADWTSVVPPDPFVAVSAGRALCRPDDLLALVALLRALEEGPAPARSGAGDPGEL